MLFRSGKAYITADGTIKDCNDSNKLDANGNNISVTGKENNKDIVKVIFVFQTHLPVVTVDGEKLTTLTQPKYVVFNIVK